MSRTRIRHTEKSSIVSVRTTDRLRATFEQAAARHDMSTSDVLRGLMAEWSSNPRPISHFLPADAGAVAA